MSNSTSKESIAEEVKAGPSTDLSPIKEEQSGAPVEDSMMLRAPEVRNASKDSVELMAEVSNIRDRKSGDAMMRGLFSAADLRARAVSDASHAMQTNTHRASDKMKAVFNKPVFDADSVHKIFEACHQNLDGARQFMMVVSDGFKHPELNHITASIGEHYDILKQSQEKTKQMKEMMELMKEKTKDWEECFLTMRQEQINLKSAINKYTSQRMNFRSDLKGALEAISTSRSVMEEVLDQFRGLISAEKAPSTASLFQGKNKKTSTLSKKSSSCTSFGLSASSSSSSRINKSSEEEVMEPKRRRLFSANPHDRSDSEDA
ncbi:unnamed protein product [Amoebophrya sp. A25]|nr:unnamed protein product [Amoebophrya sp. A25]|eukprot:GSA25T00023944001.1